MKTVSVFHLFISVNCIVLIILLFTNCPGGSKNGEEVVEEPTIYIADLGNDRIAKMEDMTGTNFVTYDGDGGSAPLYGYDGPVDIYVTESGEFYLTDTNKHRVVYMEDFLGTNAKSLGIYGQGTNEFWGTYGLWLDTDEKIYVVDWGNDRIVRIDNIDGDNWLSYSGPVDDLFSEPLDIFSDGDNNIYVVDSGNDRIVRMDDMTGTNWTTFGELGSGINQFDRPTSMFIDRNDRIYISDSENNRIVRIDNMNGDNWISYENSSDPFDIPWGVYVDSQGRIYIADRYNDRVVRMDDMNGTDWTVFTGDADPLFNPIGVFCTE